MDDTQTTTSAPFAQGQVSLPNDGQILSTDTPDASESQQPTQTPPQPSNGFQGNVPALNPPLGNTAPQGQPPQAPQGQGPQTTAPAPTKPTVPPAVQKASMFHDVALALAGGPRYKYTVDAEGNMQKVPLPISNAHIGMAIALEALSGAFTGLGQHGPNAAGQAAQQGFQQGFQTNEQQQEKPKEQAQQDFARRAQVTETNMRMYSMARQMGKEDAEQNDKYIEQFKDLADRVQGEFPTYVKGVATYDDLKKYNITEDNAIPYMRVPRRDSNGNQVTDAKGVPQWDMDYLIVDPSLKASKLLGPNVRQWAKETGKNWADNPLLDSSPMGLRMAMSFYTQAAQWGIAKQNFQNFQDTLEKANNNNAGTVPQNLGMLTQPNLKNEAVSSLADQVAQKYADQVKDIMPADSFNALVKGVIQQESGGNPNVQNNPTSGAMGLGQLLPSTAKMLGVTDPHNPTQNVEGTAKYLSQLLQQYKDPRMALAAYGGGLVDGKITPNGQKYVDSISTMVGGLNNSQLPSENVNNSDNFKVPNLAEAAKENPALSSAIAQFMPALAESGSYRQAIAHLMSKPETQAAGSAMTALLGGFDNIEKVDSYRAAQIQAHSEQTKTDIQTNALEQRAKNKTALDSAAEQKKQEMVDTLDKAQVPDNVLRMDPKDVVTNLQGQGVTLDPEAIRDALQIAKYKAPLNVASNKLWFKSARMDQQGLLDIVTQLNPNYKEANYKNLAAYGNPNSQVGKTVFAASGVANHLNLLLDAAKEVAGKGEGAGQYPILNKLENEFNYHTGGTAFSRLSGLTNAINGEMGKVLAGGFAPDKPQVEALMKNMTPENSLNQINALGSLYTDIMYGKIKPFDEAFEKQSGGMHMDNIPASFTNLAQKYGKDTPWEPGQGQKQGQGTQPNSANTKSDPNARPNEIPVYVKGKIIGYSMPGKQGMRPVAQ
jgi:hypothetical protein